jgi:hypothetical protein
MFDVDALLPAPDEPDVPVAPFVLLDPEVPVLVEVLLFVDEGAMGLVMAVRPLIGVMLMAGALLA